MSKSNLARKGTSALIALFVSAAFGAESPSDSQQMLAQNSSVKVTRAEFEAEIQRIPVELRTEFLMSNKRVGDLAFHHLIDSLQKERQELQLMSNEMIQGLQTELEEARKPGSPR